jgi:hypothetical protein
MANDPPRERALCFAFLRARIAGTSDEIENLDRAICALFYSNQRALRRDAIARLMLNIFFEYVCARDLWARVVRDCASIACTATPKQERITLVRDLLRAFLACDDWLPAISIANRAGVGTLDDARMASAFAGAPPRFVVCDDATACNATLFSMVYCECARDDDTQARADQRADAVHSAATLDRAHAVIIARCTPRLRAFLQHHARADINAQPFSRNGAAANAIRAAIARIDGVSADVERALEFAQEESPFRTDDVARAAICDSRHIFARGPFRSSADAQSAMNIWRLRCALRVSPHADRCWLESRAGALFIVRECKASARRKQDRAVARELRACSAALIDFAIECLWRYVAGFSAAEVWFDGARAFLLREYPLATVRAPPRRIHPAIALIIEENRSAIAQRVSHWQREIISVARIENALLVRDPARVRATGIGCGALAECAARAGAMMRDFL